MLVNESDVENKEKLICESKKPRLLLYVSVQEEDFVWYKLDFNSAIAF